MAKSPRQPAEDIFPLRLAANERALLLEHADELEESVFDCLKNTPAEEPLSLNFDQLEELAMHVTALIGCVPKVQIDGIFRKVSDGMGVLAAAEEEAGSDELRQVISIKKERDARRPRRRSR